MLTIALMLALTQVDEDLPFPPDPFDHNLPQLSVNDTDPKASKDPSFLHVGLCVGTDIDQQPVMIADRLCMNRSAAEILNAEVQTRTQDMVKLSNENEKLTKNVSDMGGGFVIGAIMSFIAMLAAFVAGIAVGKRS